MKDLRVQTQPKKPSFINAEDTVKKGALWLGGFIAVVFLWSALAPITSAIIATGSLTNGATLKTVSHEAGGVLKTVAVAEGQRVKAGDVLLRFDLADTSARNEQIKTRLSSISAREKRLEAELRGEAIFQLDDTDRIAADQNNEFAVRQSRRRADLAVLEAQKSALLEQKAGLFGQTKAMKFERLAAAKQVDALIELDRKGYGRKSRLWQAQQVLASADRELSRVRSELGAIDYRIAELSSNEDKARAAFKEGVSQELAQVRAEKLELEEQGIASGKNAARAALTSPVDGVIAEIHTTTVGSAVRPYEALVDIVPAKESLQVEARIRPIDIDDVYVGQEARLVLSSFNRNKVDPLNGKVTFLSPDSRTDERTGETFYVARLQVADIQDIKHLTLTAGMPVETYITTGKQSFLGYLISPFTDSFGRAFRG